MDLTENAWEFGDMLGYTVGQIPIDIISGFVPSGTLTVLYGMPSTGKTFVALSLAFSVAMEHPWCDTDIEISGNVGMFALEYDREKLARRFQAYSNKYNFTKVKHKMLFNGSCKLRLLSCKADLYHFVKSNKIRLLIIDTLDSVFEGNKNNPDDMGNVTQALQEVAGDTGCGIVLVHHTAKPTAQFVSNTPRGSSVLMGAVRSQIYVTGNRMGRRIEQTKCNESEEEANSFGFVIEKQHIGTNTKGKVIDAGVFVPIIHHDKEWCKKHLDIVSGIPKNKMYKTLNPSVADRTFDSWISEWVSDGILEAEGSTSNRRYTYRGTLRQNSSIDFG